MSSSGSPVSAAFWSGVREAVGVPSAVVAAGYFGFGALLTGVQFPLWAAMLGTLTIWALPGQLVLVEMVGNGAAYAFIIVSVSITSARFLPMAASLMPLLRAPGQRSWHRYAAAHVVTMTPWAASMRRCPDLPPRERMPYFIGFALTTWFGCIAATAVGYYFADAFPPLVQRSLAFLGPLYFVLILAGEARTRVGLLAVACGAIAGPLAYAWTPQWSVLLAGLVGGTIAFLLLRSLRERA